MLLCYVNERLSYQDIITEWLDFALRKDLFSRVSSYVGAEVCTAEVQSQFLTSITARLP